MMIQAYYKVQDVIQSCSKINHFTATRNMILNFYKIYKDDDLYILLENEYENKISEFV